MARVEKCPCGHFRIVMWTRRRFIISPKGLGFITSRFLEKLSPKSGNGRNKLRNWCLMVFFYNFVFSSLTTRTNLQLLAVFRSIQSQVSMWTKWQPRMKKGWEDWRWYNSEGRVKVAVGAYQAIRIKYYRDSLTREGNIYILFRANLRSKSIVVTFGTFDVEERTRNTD